MNRLEICKFIRYTIENNVPKVDKALLEEVFETEVVDVGKVLDHGFDPNKFGFLAWRRIEKFDQYLIGLYC